MLRSLQACSELVPRVELIFLLSELGILIIKGQWKASRSGTLDLLRWANRIRYGFRNLRSYFIKLFSSDVMLYGVYQSLAENVVGLWHHADDFVSSVNINSCVAQFFKVSQSQLHLLLLHRCRYPRNQSCPSSP